MGFTFPWAQWMKNELKALCEEGLSALKQHPLINGDEIDSIWQRFLSNDKRITWSRIWPLVVLGQWIYHNDIKA
jgi:asparagine synthase (glutamine-hydrolysing)